MNRRATFGLAALLLLASPLALAQEIPCEFSAVERIVAIGDVHGAYEAFVENLRASGLIDNELNWAGGTTHFVQTGDVLDRGPESRRAMDLLMKLESQAEAAGGKVHALIGNHEFWVAIGELSFVSRAEFEAFEGDRDKELRSRAGGEARPGELALREAYGPEGVYGQFIRRNNAAVKIGDIVFVHGGLHPDVAKLGLCEINNRVRAELNGELSSESFSVSFDGPLMTRTYSEEDLPPELEVERTPMLEEALRALDAQRMVMGHTVTFGLIEPRFDGRAMLIDAGMLDIYLGGHRAALVIENGEFAGVYPNGTVTVPARLDDEAGAGYIESVVAASPGDAALEYRLARVRMKQARTQEACELFEAVGVIDARVRLPYSWRREAAECFQSIGEVRKAEELHTLYLKGFGTYATRMGSEGAPLLNSFARECLRLGLMTEEAFDAARRAAEAAPTNQPYKLTLSWAYIQKGEPFRATRVLRNAIRRGEDNFEARFLLGRAFQELGENEKAMAEFDAAAEFEPDHPELKQAMAELKQ